jgi:ubiquinone/menaquinone biosynthesis C-methylase UbiE
VGRLSAADVSSACVEEARRRNPWVEYEVSRGTRLPYEDRTFDLVLTVCVLHHVPPADRLAFAGELRRVARPGGLVCVIEHNPFNPLTRLAVMRCAFDRDAVLLRAGRTERLLRAAGLRALETRFFLLLPTKRGPAPWLEHRLRRVPLGAQYLTCGEA